MDPPTRDSTAPSFLRVLAGTLCGPKGTPCAAIGSEEEASLGSLRLCLQQPSMLRAAILRHRAEAQRDGVQKDVAGGHEAVGAGSRVSDVNAAAGGISDQTLSGDGVVAGVSGDSVVAGACGDGADMLAQGECVLRARTMVARLLASWPDMPLPALGIPAPVLLGVLERVRAQRLPGDVAGCVRTLVHLLQPERLQDVALAALDLLCRRGQPRTVAFQLMPARPRRLAGTVLPAVNACVRMHVLPLGSSVPMHA